MKYITWEEQDSYPVAILIKEAAVSRSAAESTYIKQLGRAWCSPQECHRALFGLRGQEGICQGDQGVHQRS